MEKTKEEKRGQFQRLEGEIAEESKRLAIAIGGAAIYSAGVNLFIVPAGLYSGGIMGFAQIVRTILVSYLHLPIQNFDIAGLIYYAINIPVLLLPGDTFATRQPDPVLQQVEHTNNLSVTTNDAFKAVTKYWDRVTRPEQLMSAMINAMRFLTDIGNTGAVCVAMPQDVQGEVYEFPESFLAKRVHVIDRRIGTPTEFKNAVELIKRKKKLS